MSVSSAPAPGLRLRRLAYLLVLALTVAIAVSALGAATASAACQPEFVNGEEVPCGSSPNHLSVGGSDALDNVTSSELSTSEARYWQKYSIGRYGLDYHVTNVSFDVGSEILPWDSGEGVDFSGIPAMMASWMVKVVWYACLYAAYGALALFMFAFNFDLLDSGPGGALDPISSAIKAVDDAMGLEWVAITVTIFGLWAMWRALVQRRYGEAVGGFVGSGAILLCALAFTLYAVPIVNLASDALDGASDKLLAVGSAMAPEIGETSPQIDAGEANDLANNHINGGTLHATDALFKLLVYDPFTVLQFGGLEHCASVGDKVSEDEAPVSMPVDKCPDQNPRMGPPYGGSGGAQFDLISNSYYTNRYLSYNAGDSHRCCDGDRSEYQAINVGDTEGHLPRPEDVGGQLDPVPPAYPRDLGEQDAPAVDMQQQPAQFQRLGMTVMTAFFIFGGVLLIVGLSIAVIVAQLLFLLVLAFAPIIAIISFIPVHGPEIGLGWLKRMAILAGAKLYYSMLLALIIAVAFALLSASGNQHLGWLMATALTGLFFWILFFYRNRLQALITASAASAGRWGMAKYAAAGAGIWAGRKVMRGTGAVTKGTAKTGMRAAGLGARGAKGVGSAAIHPKSAAVAVGRAPGRAKDVYRTGRERGLGVKDSAGAAGRSAYDRQGAKAGINQRKLDGANAERKGQERAYRKANHDAEYRKVKAKHPDWTGKKGDKRAHQEADKRLKARYQKQNPLPKKQVRAQQRTERMEGRSASRERSALNRNLQTEDKYKPRDGRPSAPRTNGSSRPNSNPRARPSGKRTRTP